MSAMDNNKKLLSSWKEIASYLRCGIRTCRRWEQDYGLPIHRVSKTSKTTVHAYKDELDRWLKNKKGNNKITFFKLNSLIRISLILFPLTVGFIYLYFNFTGNSQPVDLKIIGSNLIALDERGDEIWRFDTKVENLIELDLYKEHWKTRKKQKLEDGSLSVNKPFVIFKDINNDKRTEVLFCAVTKNEYGGGKLFCINHRGNQIWKFEAGREINFGNETFSDFTINGIFAEDLDGDSNLEIIVISHAILRFPTQLCILSSDGAIVGEYWNSGQLTDICFADITKVGKKNLIVSGLNNEYSKGCLIAFNSYELNGGSPQKEKRYICKELGPGSFLYYILFPRTDVDLNEYVIEAAGSIEFDSNSNFIIDMQKSRLFFVLDFSFVVKDIIYGHRFLDKHRRLKDENKISSTPDDNYRKDLIRNVLYWDGQNWVSTPTMTSYWKNKAIDN